MAAATPSGQDSAPPTPQHQGRAISDKDEADKATYPSHGIAVDLPAIQAADGRPIPVKHLSAPAYQSPIRHHRRQPSRTRAVKETVNARSHYGSSDDDGASVHRVNQYIIKQEIGRGSFGAVFLATDQYGNEFAVKEFSKSRLRKRAQSNLLRTPNTTQRRPGQLASGFNSPLHRILPTDKKNIGPAKPFELIKEEIAIMKKLNHHNVVSLIEVLDDPAEDTLYMVLEMCKKGIVMKVGLESRAEPYSDEECRCWFRDMILGIEYLHAQGIIHRDIKPDNCLVNEEDVLKIVDFGVSEMFEKASDMSTTKSAGSPAFMPPELCVAKHGSVSGRAADIWSMGATLYCLRYGHIPFERSGMLQLYDSIREDPVPLDEEHDDRFRDLMQRLLEKDPEKRISMPQLREHPWVTKNGTDPLCPEEENCAELVEPPTEAEMNRAITGNMANLMVVMKAVRRFKALVARKRPYLRESILGQDSRLMAPPQSIAKSSRTTASRSSDALDRKPFEQVLVAEGVHRDIAVDDQMRKLPLAITELSVKQTKALAREQPGLSRGQTDNSVMEHLHHNTRANTFPAEDHAKGHAHDPLDEHLFLHIGVGGASTVDDTELVVAESPTAVEDNIYERAYQDEMKRIDAEQGKSAALYLNRRVEHLSDLKSQFNVAADCSKQAAKVGVRQLSSSASATFADMVRQASAQASSTLNRPSALDRANVQPYPGT